MATIMSVADIGSLHSRYVRLTDRFKSVWTYHQFASAVEHFHRVIEHAVGFSHLAADVHKLADTARHFHRAVQGGASYEHARRDFAKIQQAFHHTEEALKHAHGVHHSPHVMRDWAEVQYSFEDLDWSMGG